MARSLSFSRRSVSVLTGATAAAAMALTGCAGNSGGTDAAAPAAASAKLPADALVKGGRITYCSDISAPPLTYYDAAQKPVGAEVELGDALATEARGQGELGQHQLLGIIPALQAKQCDAIISQLYIKPEREKVVDFVPYMYASNTLLVARKNAGAIKGADDLCGRKAAGQTGTTIVQYLTDQSRKCTAAGRPDRHPPVRQGQRRLPAAAPRPGRRLRHDAGDRRVRTEAAAGRLQPLRRTLQPDQDRHRHDPQGQQVPARRPRRGPGRAAQERQRTTRSSSSGT